jgi:hypothetical protein
MPFQDARDYVRSLKLNNWESFKTLYKEGSLPKNIPSKPYNSYKSEGWISVGDFLGTGRISNQNRIYKSFDEAKKFLKPLKFKSRGEYYKWHRLNKPTDLPSNLHKIYGQNNKWKGLGNFLGNGYIATNLREYYSYDEARAVVQRLNIKSQAKYFEWRKKNRNKKIPSNPQIQYEGKGWVSWSDYLGNGVIANKDKIFFEYAEAKKFISKFELKSLKEWNQFKKTNELPKKMPRNPDGVYNGKGWKGWSDFLGTDNLSHTQRSKKFLKYTEARKKIRVLKFTSISEFKRYYKNNNFDGLVPSNPNTTYKNKGWKGWSDFLGTEIISTNDKIYMTYDEAKKYVKSLGLKSSSDWNNYKKNNLLNPNIPRGPREVYHNKGWKGWDDFLGLPKKKIYTYSEAKKKVKLLGFKNSREYKANYKSDPHLPSTPQEYYAEDWKGWNEFLEKI